MFVKQKYLIYDLHIISSIDLPEGPPHFDINLLNHPTVDISTIDHRSKS